MLPPDGACKGAAGAGFGSPADAPLARAAAYVCYSPRRLASAEAIAQRREALASGVGFGHQAHHLHAPPGTMPGAPVGADASGMQLKWEDLTEGQWALVGYGNAD